MTESERFCNSDSGARSGGRLGTEAALGLEKRRKTGAFSPGYSYKSRRVLLVLGGGSDAAGRKMSVRIGSHPARASPNGVHVAERLIRAQDLFA